MPVKPKKVTYMPLKLAADLTGYSVVTLNKLCREKKVKFTRGEKIGKRSGTRWFTVDQTEVLFERQEKRGIK